MARVRHVPGTWDRMAASPYVIQAPFSRRNRWQQLFPNAHPLVLEVGSGRGRFLYEMAKAHPEFNYIGLDIVPEIIMEALDTYSTRPDWPDNIRFLCIDAAHLDRAFPAASLQRIYLHFSDPWPKRRHGNRRLTAPRFLDIYRHLLREDGFLLFKTDFAPFYRWSLKTICAAGWHVQSATDDLYQAPPADNIPTEYEQRFAKKGTPIGRIIATPPSRPCIAEC